MIADGNGGDDVMATVELSASDERGEAFMGLVQRAEAGDEEAARALRPILRSVPKLAGQLGDLAAIARRAWVGRIAGAQLGFAEGILGTLETMRAELAAQSDGPLERLLVDRVALCWLHLHYAELTYAQRMATLDVEWSEHFQRRIDRAQRRYLQAIRTLAQVRRLVVPPVQINVGGQQANQVVQGVTTVA
jgi:hypothetical protein